MQIQIKGSEVTAQIITSGFSVMLSIWTHSDGARPHMQTAMSLAGIEPDAADKLADALKLTARQCRGQRADSERLISILEVA